MVHGASGTRRNWALLGAELAKNGFYAISVDMPAHGSRYKEKLTMESGMAFGPFRIHYEDAKPYLTALEAIAEAIETLVPSKKAFVFGGSMGGYIAMAFGGRYTQLCRYALLSRS